MANIVRIKESISSACIAREWQQVMRYLEIYSNICDNGVDGRDLDDIRAYYWSCMAEAAFHLRNDVNYSIDCCKRALNLQEDSVSAKIVACNILLEVGSDLIATSGFGERARRSCRHSLICDPIETETFLTEYVKTFQRVERRCILSAMQAMSPLVKDTLLSVFGLLDTCDIVTILDQVMRECRPAPQHIESNAEYENLVSFVYLRTCLRLLKPLSLLTDWDSSFQCMLHYDATLARAIIYECLGESGNCKADLLMIVNNAQRDCDKLGEIVKSSLMQIASHSIVRAAVSELEAFPSNRNLDATRACISVPFLCENEVSFDYCYRYESYLSNRIKAALCYLLAVATLSEARANSSDHIFIVDHPSPRSSPDNLSSSGLKQDAMSNVWSLVQAGMEYTERNVSSFTHELLNKQSTLLLEPDFCSLVALLPILSTDPYYLFHNSVESSLAALRRVLLRHSYSISGVLSQSPEAVVANLELYSSCDIYPDVLAIWFLGIEYEGLGRIEDALRMYQMCERPFIEYLKPYWGPKLRSPRHFVKVLNWLGENDIVSLQWRHLPLSRASFACLDSPSKSDRCALNYANKILSLDNSYNCLLKIFGSSIMHSQISSSLVLRDEIDRDHRCDLQILQHASEFDDVVYLFAKIHASMGGLFYCHAKFDSSAGVSEKQQHLILAAKLYALLFLEPMQNVGWSDREPIKLADGLLPNIDVKHWTPKHLYPEKRTLEYAVLLAELGEISAAITMVKCGLKFEKFPSSNSMSHLLALLLPCTLDSPKVLATSVTLAIKSNQESENINRLCSTMKLQLRSDDLIGAEVTLNAVLSSSMNLAENFVTDDLNMLSFVKKIRLTEILVECCRYLRAFHRFSEANDALGCAWNVLVDSRIEHINEIVLDVGQWLAKCQNIFEISMLQAWRSRLLHHPYPSSQVIAQMEAVILCELSELALISCRDSTGFDDAPFYLLELALSICPTHDEALIKLASFEADSLLCSKASSCKSVCHTRKEYDATDYCSLLSGDNEFGLFVVEDDHAHTFNQSEGEPGKSRPTKYLSKFPQSAPNSSRAWGLCSRLLERRDNSSDEDMLYSGLISGLESLDGLINKPKFAFVLTDFIFD